MVTIRCFAGIREALGQGLFELPFPSGALYAKDILAAVAGQRLATLPKPVLVAINQEHASLESSVQDGDELAFFPPVSGG